MSSLLPLSHTVYQNASCGYKFPLIILHGLLGSKQNWNSICKSLGSKNIGKIVAVDLRNHGESPHSDTMDYFTMAEDVAHLMQSLSIPKAALIGHSMGGKVAMCLALTKPSLVERLMSVDVAPRQSPVRGFDHFVRSMQTAELNRPSVNISQMRRQLDKEFSQTIQQPSIRAFLLTNLIANGSGCSGSKFRWRVNLSAINRAESQLIDFPLFDAGTQYTGPTLFVRGETSDYIVSSDMPGIHALFPRAQLTTVPGAGHWVHADQPIAFMDLLCKFVLDSS